jgi:hypothetical protein
MAFTPAQQRWYSAMAVAEKNSPLPGWKAPRKVFSMALELAAMSVSGSGAGWIRKNQ